MKRIIVIYLVSIFFFTSNNSFCQKSDICIDSVFINVSIKKSMEINDIDTVDLFRVLLEEYMNTNPNKCLGNSIYDFEYISSKGYAKITQEHLRTNRFYFLFIINSILKEDLYTKHKEIAIKNRKGLLITDAYSWDNWEGTVSCMTKKNKNNRIMNKIIRVYKRWFSKVDGLSMEEIRRRKIFPLDKSKYQWYLK